LTLVQYAFVHICYVFRRNDQHVVWEVWLYIPVWNEKWWYGYDCDTVCVCVCTCVWGVTGRTCPSSTQSQSLAITCKKPEQMPCWRLRSLWLMDWNTAEVVRLHVSIISHTDESASVW